MPAQKDLKRIVRSRMQKTGESYTAARLQLVKKFEPAPDYEKLAGLSDVSVKKQTGRDWAEWVRTLDTAKAADMQHRDIAKYVSSLGTPSWWSQMVTVGYERIRGLRDRQQQRGGMYGASKSRTFPVPVAKLFEAFASAAKRRKWLPVKITVRSSTRDKRMRIVWDDETPVQLGFFAKGNAKSYVSVQHEKLRDKAHVDVMKKTWAEHLDRLGEYLR